MANLRGRIMSNKLIWTGRILSGLTGVIMLTIGLSILFARSAEVMDGFAKFGYPVNAIAPIGWATLVGSVLYLIPRTAVLGAIVLTGYFGGAVATHLRISDSFIAPLMAGIFVWLGLFLRDGKVRALFPLRR